jgi:hypothetical protein
LEGEIKELESKKEGYRQVIGGLEKEKEESVGTLRKLGVKAAADLKNNPRAQRLADRLAQVAHELTVARKRQGEYGEAAETAKFKLRRFERLLILKRAGITDGELTEVSTVIAQLDAKLKSASENPTPNPLTVEAALEQELKAP